MDKKRNLLLLVAICAGAFVWGQTSNTGMLTILPGTEVSVLDNLENTTSALLYNDGQLYLSGNTLNEGDWTYSWDTGTTHYVGQVDQFSTGSQMYELYNTVFNMTGDSREVIVDATWSLNGNSNFINGIVQNRTEGGIVVFENGATHNGGSDASFLDGTALKAGNEAFDFPIGHIQYHRNAQVSALSNITDLVSATYYLENSHEIHPHHLAVGIIEFIDDMEYWVLERVEGNSPVVLTLGWNQGTTSEELLKDPTAIHIVRWDPDLGLWVDEGGIVNESNRTVTTISEVSGYGMFTLAKVKKEEVLAEGLVVYNSITANQDGTNDFFFIDGISKYPDNELVIFNRWGTKVYEAKGYNETDNVFRGYSQAPTTYKSEEKLPAGTYFYVLRYNYGNGDETKIAKRAGYLYINAND
ncbi:gliding motility-associated C-terminal domain-containing protein [Flagellimonas aurea]|uniref:gliding motility-associated C-terminal domain-containing protein n=1 Tax=Flagellimonas aurea TaxID=2915619 RepID=UPI0035D11649